MSHTPGPWLVHPRNPEWVVVGSDAQKAIGGSADPDREAEYFAKQIVRVQRESEFVEFHRSRVVSRDEAEANARLIAAAPDLLAACKSALGWYDLDGDGVSDPTLTQLRNAIAKAEGVK